MAKFTYFKRGDILKIKPGHENFVWERCHNTDIRDGNWQMVQEDKQDDHLNVLLLSLEEYPNGIEHFEDEQSLKDEAWWMDSKHFKKVKDN